MPKRTGQVPGTSSVIIFTGLGCLEAKCGGPASSGKHYVNGGPDAGICPFFPLEPFFLLSKTVSSPWAKIPEVPFPSWIHKQSRPLEREKDTKREIRRQSQLVALSFPCLPSPLFSVLFSSRLSFFPLPLPLPASPRLASLRHAKVTRRPGLARKKKKTPTQRPGL